MTHSRCPALALGLLAAAALTLPAPTGVEAQTATSQRTPLKLTQPKIQQLWLDLHGGEPNRIRPAIETLAAGGEPVARFLKSQIQLQLQDVTPQGLKPLVSKLDSGNYSEREDASRRLAAIAPAVRRQLELALRRASSDEARVRLERILLPGKQLEFGQLPQLTRAEAVLRGLRTPVAKQALKLIEESPHRPYLRYVQDGKWHLEAGFVPDKTRYVLGEPLGCITFVVRNLSSKALGFEGGGDYRGRGRPERFRVHAVDANGIDVADPRAATPPMGGIVRRVSIEPGKVYTEALVVADWRTLDKPGVYTFTCERRLFGGVFSWGLPNRPIPPPKPGEIQVLTQFVITIEPFDKGKMQAVLGDLVEQIRASRRAKLNGLMDKLCSFSGEMPVPHLVGLSTDAHPEVRLPAIHRLGNYKTPAAEKAVLKAFRDTDRRIRIAAAGALGRINTKNTVDALIEALPKEDGLVELAILRGMGLTRSARVLDTLVRSLGDKDHDVRMAAVDALADFGGPKAVAALKRHVNDDDLRFREHVVRKLVESLRQPLDVEWLIPVVRANKDKRQECDSVRLIRLYGGQKALPALIRCLDLDNPRVDGYHNFILAIYMEACEGGLKLPWVHDANRKGKPEEIGRNKRILAGLKAWLEHYRKTGLNRGYPARGRGVDETWGQEVDGLKIRVAAKQTTWPETLTPVFYAEVRNTSGKPVSLAAMPELFVVELEGQRYHCRPAQPRERRALGNNSGWTCFVMNLGPQWRSEKDGGVLNLAPGKHALRLVVKPSSVEGLGQPLVSKPMTLEILPVAE